MIAEGIAHAYGTHKQATRDKIAIIASSSICLSFSFKNVTSLSHLILEFIVSPSQITILLLTRNLSLL
jgi:hypothetical protein